MSYVLDASALIALLGGERGAETVEDLLGAETAAGIVAGYLSAVNLTELLQRVDYDELPDLLAGPRPAVVTVAYETEHARRAAAILPTTAAAGLGLADRSCLALADMMSLPVLTSDRSWSTVDIGVEVIQIR